ncbi:hypothetical protein MD484_g2579, partial [Candolleomyces efflorescens]
MSQGRNTDVNIAEADRLKAEGNELYKREEYDAAKQKFTEAIEKNPTNAILYANRAAVHLSKNESLDAVWDCRTAVELDPTYARAWGRLAAASHAWSECISAWEKALECLSKLGRLTPAQQAMKESFALGLKKSKSDMVKIQTSALIIPEDSLRSGMLPWDVAKGMYERTVAERPTEVKPSCIFLLHSAREDFNKAMSHLDELRNVENAQGQTSLRGSLTTLEYLSDAILADKRVFGVRVGEFYDKIRMQCNFENNYQRGWIMSGGPATIKKEALERLEIEGWASVRPALAVTVRIWVFTAWFRANLEGHFDFAHEMFMNAVDVLEWGRNQWPDVSKDDRGAIFERGFIRSVKLMYLEAIHESVYRNGPTKFTSEELVQYAESVIEDVESDPDSPDTFFGHRLAFWMYPKGIALSILGWSYFKEANHSSSDGAPSIFETASKYYLQAAQNFPEDDEYHVRFLVKALECLCGMGTVPLSKTLPLCDAIRRAFDQAMVIWGASPYGETLKTNLSRVDAFEAEHRRLISEGRCTLDSVTGRLPAARA